MTLYGVRRYHQLYCVDNKHVLRRLLKTAPPVLLSDDTLNQIRTCYVRQHEAFKVISIEYLHILLVSPIQNPKNRVWVKCGFG